MDATKARGGIPRTATNTYGGGCDQTAVIGHAPESREWTPGDPVFFPQLGEGVRIEAFVTVDAGLRRATEIGARTWLMKHVHVGHDAIIEPDCELAPGVVIGGHVEIGRGVRIGIGAVVRPFITVGDGARIGCGAVVVKHVPAGEVWAGNPAKQLANEPECFSCGFAEHYPAPCPV